MRRVLVPLDGTEFAASILPDALRLAGPAGTLIFIRHASRPVYDASADFIDAFEVEQAEEYLRRLAEEGEALGIEVETHVLALGSTTGAIDQAAATYRADMIACCTHGRGPFGRLLRGSVAWKALAHSPVPVLLRHVEASADAPGPTPERRRILVPLDRSASAEQALPLATALQDEWGAELALITVVPDMFTYASAGMAWPPAYAFESDVQNAKEYGKGVVARFPRAEFCVRPGTAETQIVAAARDWGITDIVMTSHGRTGLSRVIFGSVADELIHSLHVPIIVIPWLAMQASDSTRVDVQGEPAVSAR